MGSLIIALIRLWLLGHCAQARGNRVRRYHVHQTPRLAAESMTSPPFHGAGRRNSCLAVTSGYLGGAQPPDGRPTTSRWEPLSRTPPPVLPRSEERRVGT